MGADVDTIGIVTMGGFDDFVLGLGVIVFWAEILAFSIVVKMWGNDLLATGSIAVIFVRGLLVSANLVYTAVDRIFAVLETFLESVITSELPDIFRDDNVDIGLDVTVVGANFLKDGVNPMLV